MRLLSPVKVGWLWLHPYGFWNERLMVVKDIVANSGSSNDQGIFSYKKAKEIIALLIYRTGFYFYIDTRLFVEEVNIFKPDTSIFRGFEAIHPRSITAIQPAM